MPNQLTKELWQSAGFTISPHEEKFLDNVDQTHKDSLGQISSGLYATRVLQRALADHATALVDSAEASEKHAASLTRSAEASEKHAASLTRATWALVAATIKLVYSKRCQFSHRRRG